MILGQCQQTVQMFFKPVSTLTKPQGKLPLSNQKDAQGGKRSDQSLLQCEKQFFEQDHTYYLREASQQAGTKKQRPKDRVQICEISKQDRRLEMTHTCAIAND